MKFCGFRNAVLNFLYTKVLKGIFFSFDPENIHERMVSLGVFLGKYEPTRTLTKWFFDFADPALEQTVWGIKFKNPVGLAAGFDKNGVLTQILPEVGFGFEEIGSVTGEPCAGNPKPRLWRLAKSRSLAVYYGLKNEGVEAISRRLEKINFEFPLGISIAKTNSSDTVDTGAGVADYAKAYRQMSGIGSFHVINISCPNAFGGQPFTNPESLRLLMAEIEKHRVAAPLLFKISPDLNHGQIDEILDVAHRAGINGIICANLTKNRNNPKILDKNVPKDGGLSGKIVEEKTNELIKYIYKKTNGQMIIVGCGGIFSAEDAYKKIRLGATLVELITGMIYGGPQLISDINMGLTRLLKRDGFKNISEAIGTDNKI